MLSSLRRLAGHADLARRGLELGLASNDAARSAARKHLVERLGSSRSAAEDGTDAELSHRDEAAGAELHATGKVEPLP